MHTYIGDDLYDASRAYMFLPTKNKNKKKDRWLFATRGSLRGTNGLLRSVRMASRFAPIVCVPTVQSDGRAQVRFRTAAAIAYHVEGNPGQAGPVVQVVGYGVCTFLLMMSTRFGPCDGRGGPTR